MGIKRAITLSDYIFFFYSRIEWNVLTEVQTLLAVTGDAVGVKNLTGGVEGFIYLFLKQKAML